MGNTKTDQPASLKNMSKRIKVTNTKLAAARQGRKYGYSLQKVPPKTFGKRSLGLDSTPPIIGLHRQIQHLVRCRIDKIWYPRVPPTAHTTEIKTKPSARLVESVKSPMVLFITPSGKMVVSECTRMDVLITYRYCHSKDRKGIDCFQHRFRWDRP